jgi:hypothetical protein
MLKDLRLRIIRGTWPLSIYQAVPTVPCHSRQGVGTVFSAEYVSKDSAVRAKLGGS